MSTKNDGSPLSPREPTKKKTKGGGAQRGKYTPFGILESTKSHLPL